jgi:hypothetical protein
MRTRLNPHLPLFIYVFRRLFPVPGMAELSPAFFPLFVRLDVGPALLYPSVDGSFELFPLV